MPDATARPLDDSVSGRVLDGQTSFGRARDDWREFHGLVGHSAAMQALFRAVDRLAPHARATLITGPTGAGKASLASVVHRLGPCRGGAQMTLLGGDAQVEGDVLFAAARRSRLPVTCFVPEIRDLSASQQVALVHGLTASADLPAGDGLHVVAWSTVEPDLLMSHYDVRSDLIYRLGAVRYHLPPLHERREDIAGLAVTFLREACRRLRLSERVWSGAALAVLEERPWPGNVRELQNAVQRAAALSDDSVITAHTLREALGPDLDRQGGAGGSGRAVNEGERVRVRAALAAARGNKSAAAVTLGVSRRAFYRMLERIGA